MNLTEFIVAAHKVYEDTTEYYPIIDTTTALALAEELYDTYGISTKFTVGRVFRWTVTFENTKNDYALPFAGVSEATLPKAFLLGLVSLAWKNNWFDLIPRREIAGV